MRGIAGLLSVVLLSACAGANPNQGMMLTYDTALITRIATETQTRGQLIDATMNAAARFTQEHGYRYFMVVDTADASQLVTKHIPGRPITNPNPYPKNFGTTNLSSLNLPGAQFSTPDRDVKQKRLGIDVTIRMFREGAIDPMAAGVWNTDTMLARNTAAR
jgi:hypothetical protein